MVEIISLDIYDMHEMIAIHVTGSHFLWKMIRRMVGIMVEAGRGRLTLQDAGGLLKGYSPLPSQHTAPPSGLFLHRVYYPGERILEGRENIPCLLNLD
jgi:tRNA pseudouridine38-40 synthase